ncbi:MAG TPA: sigma-54 dependent transcriptional regulator [Desulfomonilaceae bacterium]|nr:sigma-54 dependent transcriptional regulator [Desulfomonilaceae bacterium]
MHLRKSRILIVDDEEDICDLLFRFLEKEGFTPMIAHSGEAALEMIRLGMPDLIISDVRMPGMDGFELLNRTREMNSHIPVIIITAWSGIDGAVQALKNGAYDYMAKPLNIRELVSKIRKALSVAVIATPSEEPPAMQSEPVARLQALMGPSEYVARIVSEVALVGPSDFSVIIQGETGTGKELIARAIHETSKRSKGPLVAIDCGAIPETLFESELFGHEKGAFTGANTTKPGKFETSKSGTLFLDEISNMPLNSQVKLLRAIQEKSFFRVGGTKAVDSNVRLIAATNVDLNTAAKKGSFSRDLFYRLSEFTITIPALRERKEDIRHIADNILRATNVELGKQIRCFSSIAMDLLLSGAWPGNVRQLRSAVRRAVLQAQDVIEPRHLIPEDVGSLEVDPGEEQQSDSFWEGLSLKEIVRINTGQVERRAISQALRKTGGNKAKAARLLNIDNSTIHTKIKQYGIKYDPE